MFSRIHLIKPGSRVLSGLRCTSSKYKGLKRMVETCLLHMQTLMVPFVEEYITYQALSVITVSKTSVNIIARHKIKTFKIQHARLLQLKLAEYFSFHSHCLIP